MTNAGRPAVFYHYAIIDDLRSCFWSYWLDEQLGDIEKSGLNKHADIYMTITMPCDWQTDGKLIELIRNKTHEPCLFVDKVIEYINYKFPWVCILTIRDICESPNLFEGLTLNQMWHFSKMNPNRPLAYIHSKGIFSVNPQVKLWRELLNEIHINQWRQRLYDLNGYDVVGMADATTPLDNLTHISGNFFWTHTNYVSLLPEPIYIDPNAKQRIRYEYEKWILLNNPKVNFVYNSNVDHFKDYPNEPWSKNI
jgi:hypothetical protein